MCDKKRFLGIDFPCSNEKDLYRQHINGCFLSTNSNTYLEELKLLNEIFDNGDLSKVLEISYKSDLIDYVILYYSYLKDKEDKKTFNKLTYPIKDLCSSVYYLMCKYSNPYLLLLYGDLYYLDEFYAMASNIYMDDSFKYYAYAHYKRAFCLYYEYGLINDVIIEFKNACYLNKDFINKMYKDNVNIKIIEKVLKK